MPILLWFTDIEPDALCQVWPLTPETLRVEDGVYELRAVPLTSIALITSRMIQVVFTSQSNVFFWAKTGSSDWYSGPPPDLSNERGDLVSSISPGWMVRTWNNTGSRLESHAFLGVPRSHSFSRHDHQKNGEQSMYPMSWFPGSCNVSSLCFKPPY